MKENQYHLQRGKVYMETRTWIEVRSEIEKLIFFDVALGFSVLVVIFPMVIFHAPMSDFVLMLIGYSFVIIIVNCTSLLYITIVLLPRAVRTRFKFTNKEIKWDGSMTLAEELHLLAPGHERVGIFPGWKCTIGVPAGLLADLVLAGIVEIAPVKRRDGTPRHTPHPDYVITRISSPSPSNNTRDIDPIASIVLDRFFTESKTTIKTIRNWILMCKKAKISLNDGLLQRLVYRGYLKELSPSRVWIFRTPQFRLTDKGGVRSKVGLVSDFLQKGIKPSSPRDLFFLYLACYGGVGIAKKEKSIAYKRATCIKEVLPPQLKIIAEIFEVLNMENRPSIAF
ncbi:MAG: GPP34 family phosphoprotein [Candidatus Sigynarchaeota archaeon]